MNSNQGTYITNTVFFDSYTASHKPIFVECRDFYSLTYRHRGKVSITCKGKALFSSQDCVTFIPKNTPYTVETLEDVEITAVHFDILREQLPSEPTVIPNIPQSIRALFQLLTKGGISPLVRMSTLYEILAALQQLCHARTTRTIPPKILEARQRLEAQYTSPLFSIEALADALQISTTYLRREFRAAYGTSPIGFLKGLRITHAKQLLLTEAASVSDIADRCGYTSTSYFIQDFHKSVGESPAVYRSRLLMTP